MTVEALLSLNYFAALGGLVGIAAGIVLVVDLLKYRKLEKIVLKWGSWAMLLVVLFSVVMTQVYSEIFEVVPCGFCWFERLFLYPQLLIIIVGMFLKDALMPYYTLTLSAFGFIISLYHHYIQMGGSQFVTCPTAGSGADCAKRILFEFDFITFPMLAVIAFGFIIIISIYLLKARP